MEQLIESYETSDQEYVSVVFGSHPDGGRYTIYVDGAPEEWFNMAGAAGVNSVDVHEEVERAVKEGASARMGSDDLIELVLDVHSRLMGAA